MKWRILTHERLSVSLHEIDTSWSTDDVCEAHQVLDELDNAHRRALRKT